MPDLSDLGAELDKRFEVELSRAMDRLERQALEPGRDLASEHTIEWVELTIDQVLDTCAAIDQFQGDERVSSHEPSGRERERS